MHSHPLRPRAGIELLAAVTVTLGLLAALLVAMAATSPGVAAKADRDCGDFATQRAAQIFFLNAGGPGRDPHRLDADGDGIACESNPCPCYYGTTAPGGSDNGSQPKPKPKPKPITQFGRVIKVTDGDTIKVRLAAGGTKNVRLIGIDTPEVYGGVECGGRKASRSLKKLLPRGTRVRMVSDVSQAKQDRYGRLLRYVHQRKGGRDVGRAQLFRGHAKVYVHGGKPFKRVKQYRVAQREAKAGGRGIWGSC